MTPEVHDAIEAARFPVGDELSCRSGVPRRRYSFDHVWLTVLAVLRNVPEGTTLEDLRDELELANNQGPRT